MDATTDVDRIVIPEGANRADPRTLYEVLAGGMPDKCKHRGKRYTVALVLTLLLLAKMSGERGLSGIAQWARLRIDWVRVYLPLERDSLPCGNTYHNVCDQFDLDELNQRLADFFGAYTVENLLEDEGLIVEPPVGEPPIQDSHMETPQTVNGLQRPLQLPPATRGTK